MNGKPHFLKHLAALFLLTLSAVASTSTLSGTLKDAQGNPLNGSLVMQLPFPAQDTTTNSAVLPIPVYFRVVNGAITGGAALYDVATLQPLGLYYKTRAYDLSGNLVFFGNYVVTGATFNLGAATPTAITTSNVSYILPITPSGNNTFTGTNIFTQPIQIQPIDNQIVTGTPGNTTTIDFPPPTSGNLTLHFPATATQSYPTSFVQIANAGAIGTTLNTLTVLTGAPSTAVIAPAGTGSGVVGITISSAGTTGNAVIQQGGTASCPFDGATVAGHFVRPSPTIAGDCTDAGAGPAAGFQSIGQVLTSNGGAGVYAIDLFPPGILTPSLSPLTLPNNGGTGTLLNGLAKQTGAPTTVVRTAITDTGSSIGVVIAGAGTTGSATIQQQGVANCAFDGATVANDYVKLSSTIAGDCADAGATPTAQDIGQVLSTNVAAGTYAVNLFGPGSVASSLFPPQRIALGAPVSPGNTVQTIVLTESVTFPTFPGLYRADVRYSMFVTAGSNTCAALVVDTTNNRAWAPSQQAANGLGQIGLAGAEISSSSQTYAAGATATFTLQVDCNAAGTSVTVNSALFTLSPNPTTFLEVTPFLTN